ncbi:MAG: peptidase S8 [Oceanococcus sp.]|nr:MAG: peptidase S8 [Oceanococcus sp.]
MNHSLARLLKTSAFASLAIVTSAQALGPLSLPLNSALFNAIDTQVAHATTTTLAIVHPAEGIELDAVIAAAQTVGLDINGVFDNIGVFGATGTASLFQALALTGLVSRVEYNQPLQYLLDTSHQATGGQNVLNGAVGGVAYDGAGVGVAVVDSGVDGTHPDLSDRMGGNVKLVPLTGIAIPVTDSDTISAGGHGTHVAGTIAGTGAASDGIYHGAAPGATLYGVSGGTAISMHDALAGLEWVLDNHDQVSPAIRVVNNSWGAGGGAYDPGSATSVATRALVDAGVVVVFAAGNDGGDGSVQNTSPTCVDPTPGVICVASYNDQDSGIQNGPMSDFSSRGLAGAVNTYPDIAAPGDGILSPCRLTLPICLTGTNGSNEYATMSGTSMAAPHIAGIVALMLQANPSLTPAQVEDILEDTARPITTGAAYQADPANPTTPTSFDKGHGLVDVFAAVAEALNR